MPFERDGHNFEGEKLEADFIRTVLPTSFHTRAVRTLAR